MKTLLQKIIKRSEITTPRQASDLERGQSLTELALSFTFIMFLLAGTVDQRP